VPDRVKRMSQRKQAGWELLQAKKIRSMPKCLPAVMLFSLMLPNANAHIPACCEECQSLKGAIDRSQGKFYMTFKRVERFLEKKEAAEFEEYLNPYELDCLQLFDKFVTDGWPAMAATCFKKIEDGHSFVNKLSWKEKE